MPHSTSKMKAIAAILSALASAAAGAHPVMQGGALAPDAAITAAVQRTAGEEFWGALLVARDGDVIYSRGFGMADLVAIPNTEDTIFDVASVSKQYTAAAVLRLHQAGRLNIEDRVVMLVDSALQQAPIDKLNLRVHHLLDHTSGLPADIDFQANELHDRTAFIRRVMATPCAAPPGERFQYNNVNYFLLAAIIEVAADMPFDQYMHEEVFAPAGLVHTTFVRDDSVPQRLRSARVMNGQRMSVIDYGWSWGFRGATCVLSSTSETWRWLNALEDETFLQRDLLRRMITPNRFGYAFGWYVNRTSAGSRRAHHSGSTGGYRTCVLWRPDENGAVVLYSNEACDPVRIAEAVERTVFDDGATRLEVGVYVQPYELDEVGEFEVDANLQWMVQPQYITTGDDGMQVRDDRIAGILLDQAQMFSPVLLKMSDDAAAALADALESSIAEAAVAGAGPKLALRVTVDAAELDAHSAYIVNDAPPIVVARDGANVVLQIADADGQRLATVTMSPQRADDFLGRLQLALRSRGVNARSRQ